MLLISSLINSWTELQAILSAVVNYPSSQPIRLFNHQVNQLNTEVENSKSSFQNYPVITQSITQDQSIFKTINIEEILTLLRKDGFCLGIKLPQYFVQEIWELVLSTPCYGNGNKKLDFYYFEKALAEVKYNKSFVKGNYDNITIICPKIKQIESDPVLLEIATQYLEDKPLYQETKLFWRFPREANIYERRPANQKFHYHLNNSRRLRFLFYITDVDLCSSPHVCVRGSHIKKKLSHQFLRRGCSQQELKQYYGYKNIIPICGKAGLGFAEDPLCFHQGHPPASKDRLTLQIDFALKP